MRNEDALPEWEQPIRVGMKFPGFRAYAQSRCNALCASYGFSPLEAEAIWVEFVGRQSYLARNRLVRFEVNTHWHDVPILGNVILGTSAQEFPSTEVRSVALWRSARLLGGDDRVGNYRLEGRTLQSFFDQALADLQEYGREFLEGDLRQFEAAVADQSAEMERWKKSY